MKKLIHINKHIISSNNKNNENAPAITCKTYKDNQYFHQIEVLDSEGNVCLKVIQADGKNIKPLNCGAKVWIETNSEIRGVIY